MMQILLRGLSIKSMNHVVSSELPYDDIDDCIDGENLGMYSCSRRGEDEEVVA